MQFQGRLRLGGVEDELDVLVEVDESHLKLVSGNESLGSWCLADVVANRLVANEFEIDLDGETVVFLAEDQVNFAYGAVQTMAEGWARYHSMNSVRRHRAVAAARRECESSRLAEVTKALVGAQDELQEYQSGLSVIDRPEREVQPSTGESDDGGFWARVERATAHESAGQEGTAVPSDPSRRRVPRLDSFPRRPAPLRPAPVEPVELTEDEAPAPWVKPATEPVPLPTVPEAPLPAPERAESAAATAPVHARHHPAETSGWRATMRAIFSRSPKVPHEHSFVESTTAVGLTRRVCIECGYVSIGVAERRA